MGDHQMRHLQVDAMMKCSPILLLVLFSSCLCCLRVDAVHFPFTPDSSTSLLTGRVAERFNHVSWAVKHFFVKFQVLMSEFSFFKLYFVRAATSSCHWQQ
jgi:hypothetical protein